MDADPAPPRRGRRRAGEADARAAIVRAAALEFADSGYDGASLRAVARRAGVDPALVHHYFSDKPELFAAALELPIRPDRIVAELLAGPREVLGTSIVRAIVTRFADPATRTAVLALLRTAMGHEFAGRMMRQFLLRELLQRITGTLGFEDGERRAAFAASQIVGLMVARYGIRIGPLAEASDDDVVATIGPVLQWYLTGDRL
ncbi:MAG TPA: TetR family transcriptional regulator, partial [Amnibacterium sp.]|nr:TetR family transcriptional regulator [Amnibacterium sp.]